jgi:superfamily II DNA or RNA helicase
MSRISEALELQVDHRIRERGARYFSRGAVQVVSGTPDQVVARVRGTRPYRVRLQVADDPTSLLAQCTCPYFDGHGVCKHVWATLLMAEEQGLLDSFVASRYAALVEEDPALLDADAASDEHEDELSSWFHSSSSARADGSVRPGAGWFDELTRLRHAAVRREHSVAADAGRQPVAGAPEQLIYVLELRRTQLTEGNAIISLWTRRAKRNGSWGKPRLARVTRQMLSRFAERDRQVLALILGASAGSEGGYSQYYGDHLFELDGAALTTIAPLLAATGRLLARDLQDSDRLVPLALGSGERWAFVLRVRGEGSIWLLEGILRRGSDQIALDEPDLFLRGGWFCWKGQIAPFDDAGAFEWVLLLRRQQRLEIPREEGDALVAAIYAVSALPPVLLPDELAVERVEVPPLPILQVHRPERVGPQRKERLFVQVRFAYGDVELSEQSDVAQVLQTDPRRLIARDPEREQQARADLVALGCRPVGRQVADRGAGSPTLSLTPRKLPALTRALLDKGWRVEADGSLYRKAGPLSLRVSSGIDWFDLEGEAAFDDQRVALPRLLAAIRRGEREVLLDDGSIGVLPESWLEQYGLLGSTAQVTAETVRFRSSQVGLLDALLADQDHVRWDERAAGARQALASFETIEPVDPPKTFHGTLRDYQREALGWAAFLRRFGLGGCLADDMGLGKTVQALALLEQRRKRRVKPAERQPSLVVVPRSVVFNWCEEAARFAPKLRLHTHTGTTRLKQSEQLAVFDVLVTTYGVLRRDVLLLREMRFDYLILDESQAIKNAQSQAAKAVRVLNADHRLALSGTPIENHLGELWSLFDFLNPGMLGSSRTFKLLSSRQGELEETVGLVARAVRPLILRRTKEQVERDLPPKTEQTIYCELEPEQRRSYDEVRQFYRAKLLQKLDPELLKRSKLQVLEALLRLRQVACHPGLVDPEQLERPSAKLDVLIDKLAEVVDEGHKALVFSQFTKFLAIARERLDARGLTYEYLDGRTRKRAERVHRFQSDSDCKLFLISLKAGGLGLNLTAAEYVFLLDPWWNPAVEMQAIDRAHRIGQQRHVFAYRLIAKDTVEEKVVELQAHKRKLADAIISGDNRLLRDLTREDLELLFS